jgi:hypothetical protein
MQAPNFLNYAAPLRFVTLRSLDISAQQSGGGTIAGRR